MEKIPQPEMTPNELSVFWWALANTVGAIKFADPVRHEQFWRDLELNITHWLDVMPESHALHREVVWAWHGYLQATEGILIERIASLSESEIQAGVLHQRFLEDVLDILDDQELQS